MEEPRNPETLHPPTSVILADDEHLAGWLSQTCHVAVLRMLVILHCKPYNGPGANGQANYLNTDTPPESGDPAYITGEVPAVALAQILGTHAAAGAEAKAEEEADREVEAEAQVEAEKKKEKEDYIETILLSVSV
jgi:hypothetical protein